MSNQTKYESCKLKKISKTMKEFEEGKLKTRSNQKINSKKQAIAIGLTSANSKCEKCPKGYSQPKSGTPYCLPCLRKLLYCFFLSDYMFLHNL